MEIIDDEDTQDQFEKQSRADLATRVLKNVSKSIGAPNTWPQCEKCAMFGADQRNEHFTNLILEELKYTAPCMRSRVYVKILNFLNTVKYCHTQDIATTETEIN